MKSQCLNIKMLKYFEKNGMLNTQDAINFENSVDDVIPLIDFLIQNELNQVQVLTLETEDIINLAGLLIPLLIIGSACVSIILGYFISKSIVTQLSNIRLVTRKISRRHDLQRCYVKF